MLSASNLDAQPSHVAIIMDGNGRWATARGSMRTLGHREGAKAASRIIESAIAHKISVLTLFAFSTENSHRPPSEVRFLFKLLARSLSSELPFLIKHQIRLVMVGDRASLSDSLSKALAHVEASTAHFTQLTLAIALNYGGRWDMTQAARRMAQQVQDGVLSADTITPEVVKSHLSTHGLPDIDLCIRTGGEMRLSNFLLWDLAYAELYFSPLYWPDFTPEEFHLALLSYGKRQRRFGLTPQQRMPGYA